MSMERVPLDSETKKQNALDTAKGRYDELLAAGINYLLPGTVIDMNGQYTSYPTLRFARNAADSAEHIRVNNTNVAGEKLHNRISWYFNEVKGHVICEDNPVGVYSIFGLDLDGNQPQMDTSEKMIAAGNTVRLGDLQMIAEGFVVNTGFNAASVLVLFNIFRPIFIDKNNKKGLAGAAETLVVEKGNEVLDTLDVIFKAVVTNNSTMTEPQLRDELGLWGFHYQTAKVKSIIGGRVFLADGITGAAGAEVRIGKHFNVDGKLSKEGAKVTADASGHFSAETEIEGPTFINVRLLNFVDNSPAITIVPGTNLLTNVIHLVAGVSTL